MGEKQFPIESGSISADSRRTAIKKKLELLKHSDKKGTPDDQTALVENTAITSNIEIDRYGGIKRKSKEPKTKD